MVESADASLARVAVIADVMMKTDTTFNAVVAEMALRIHDARETIADPDACNSRIALLVMIARGHLAQAALDGNTSITEGLIVEYTDVVLFAALRLARDFQPSGAVQ